MKKLSLFIIFISLSFGIFAQANNRFLRTKSYFGTIFSSEDVSKLNTAETSKLEANKYFQKSNDYYKVADENYKKASLPIASVNKYKKKAYKNELKGAKYSIKANQIVIDANNSIKDIYTSNLKVYKTSKENDTLISNLKKITKQYQDSALNAKSKIATANEIDKAIFMDDAGFYDNKALLFQEYQFAVFNADKNIIDELRKKYDINKNNQYQNDANQVKYDITKDIYLFHPKTPKIDEILSFSASEEDLFKQYYMLGQKGNFFIQKSNTYNDTLNNVSMAIDKETDFMKKRTLVQQKKQILNEQNFQKVSAMYNYYDANEKYYQLRENHLNDYMPHDTNSSLYLNTKNYIELSKDFYQDSKRYQKLAEISIDDEKFNNLLASNDQLITSVYFQENAYDLMLRKDTNIVIIKHKLPITNQNKVVDNKQNTNNTTNKNNNTTDNKTTTKNNTTNTTKQNTTKTPEVNTITGSFVYSYSNPTPKAAYTPNGTIYRIQVGSSKYLLPVNELREYDKIYYETTSGTDLKKFLVGDYTDLDQSNTTLSDLKSKGYKDAYIVKYVNGKRSKAIYSSNYNQSRNSDNPNFNAININSTKYLIYFVQIGTFTSAKTKVDLQTSNNLYYDQLTDGRIQYFEGPYYRYADVQNKLKNVKANGYNDAFVVAYNNGSQTTVDKAIKIEQNVNTSNQVVFRVQIGAFSKTLSSNEIDQKYGKIKDIYSIHTHNSNNLTIYSAGETNTFTDAKKMQQTIANLGYTDSFVIAFKNGKQVSLSSVIK